MLKTGWVESFVPSILRPYVYLLRLDRPVGVWLLLLPCWWSVFLATGGLWSLGFKDVVLILLFGAGALIMRAAGCIVNDLWDRRLDAQVERTAERPLAAGTVTVWNAYLILSVLLIMGFLVLVQLSPVAIMIGIVSIPLIFIYPLMKRFTWWPQAFLGVTFNLGALMGWASVNMEVSAAAFFLYLGGIAWTLGYDTIYAHQDKEDDVRIGIKSTAIKFGAESLKWVKGFYAGAFALILLSFLLAPAGILSLLILLPAGAHLYWQTKLWKMDDPSSSLKVFRMNRDFGLLVLLAALL